MDACSHIMCFCECKSHRGMTAAAVHCHLDALQSALCEKTLRGTKNERVRGVERMTRDSMKDRWRDMG